MLGESGPNVDSAGNPPESGQVWAKLRIYRELARTRPFCMTLAHVGPILWGLARVRSNRGQTRLEWPDFGQADQICGEFGAISNSWRARRILGRIRPFPGGLGSSRVSLKVGEVWGFEGGPRRKARESEGSSRGVNSCSEEDLMVQTCSRVGGGVSRGLANEGRKYGQQLIAIGSTARPCVEHVDML